MTHPGATFDDVAELYDAIRPGYPESLIVELVSRAELHPGAALLEIGPGTGQATLPLAKRGYRITGVEVGPKMARTAQEKFKPYPNVEIVNAAFEDVRLPSAAFDLVYAATAFHWISPEIRFAKSHALLKPSGHLAIIHQHNVSDKQGDAFTSATQPIYKRYEQKTYADYPYMPPRLADLRPEPIDEALFAPVSFDTFLVVAAYSAAEYVRLLSTYSPTLAMSADMRAAFLHDMRRLIHEQFGDHVLRHYGMSLQVARKK